jgi:hypothetical protein
VPLCPPELTKGAVYLVRDPRSVAVSFAKHLGKSIDDTITLMSKEQGALVREDRQGHFLQSWSQHVRSWLEEDGMIRAGCVRYEDLRADPETMFVKVFECLGMKDHKQVMDRIPWAIEQSTLSRMREQEKAHGFKEASQHAPKDFFGDGSIDGWRDVLTQEQIERIETDHGDVMEELNYELVFSREPVAA